MHCALLQDWTTISGVTGNNQTISQADSAVVDTGPFRDALFYLDVGGVSLAGGGTLTLFYDAAPLKDEFFFVPLNTGVAIGTVGPATPFAASPLARWLRWRLYRSGSGNWNVTFRILAGLR